MNSATETESSEDDEQCVRLIRKTMEARNERQHNMRYNFLYVGSVILGVLLVLLTLIWIVNYRGGFGWTDPDLEFNWHPFLMVLGLVFIYGQSMLIYRTARNTRKKRTKLIHAGLHISAFVLAVYALKAVFDSHNYANPPKPNLYSLHSWIGIVTVIIFSCQLVAGFVTFLYPGLPTILRQAYMYIHTSFGTACFVMVIITAAMGMLEKIMFVDKNYTSLHGEAVLVNIMGATLVFFGLLVLHLVNEPSYKRVPLPEDEMILAGDVE